MDNGNGWIHHKMEGKERKEKKRKPLIHNAHDALILDIGLGLTQLTNHSLCTLG
jgi:hypothetical protein